MGPHDNFNSVPARPRCSWDIKTAPWTDGKGNADQYIKAVKLWKEFHDTLPANYSSKIPANLQGIFLKSQLFGRAADIGEKVTEEELKSANGAIKLAKAVFKIDALSQVNTMSEEFSKLLSTSRGEREKMKSFESRFEAQVCRFNESSGSSILPDALLALLLLNNANVENNQRVSVLAAVAPKSTESLDSEALREAIKYEQVASIIRSSDSITNSSNEYLSASSAHTKPNDRISSISEKKRNSRCAACGEVGHWHKDPECPKNQRKHGSEEDVREENRRKKNTVVFN